MYLTGNVTLILGVGRKDDKQATVDSERLRTRDEGGGMWDDEE